MEIQELSQFSGDSHGNDGKSDKISLLPPSGVKKPGGRETLAVALRGKPGANSSIGSAVEVYLSARGVHDLERAKRKQLSKSGAIQLNSHE